jgi:CheY-like chemotaxis protein
VSFAYSPQPRTGAPAAGAAVCSPMPDPRPPRVLVVDDHPDGAEATAQLLDIYGCDTRTAHTCAEALAVVTGDAPFVPDVVFLDVRLPDGDGFGLAGELCGLLAARPVLVALTGLAGLDAQCRAAGFDHYLLKPADPNALAAIVATRKQ